ncbi:MAG: molybdopterin cofactor-binding domain-containing protein [Dehalococcoidia bacterium]
MPEGTASAPLTFKVNGVEHRLQPKPGQTLLEVLRDELRLTGAKRGCEDGVCGTCTVTLNGAMARACRVSLERAEGAEVVTIEGLNGAGELHPLQQAFIEADAVQCGFCTPGMIMAAKALLDRNPAPAREQIARALGSNLCRCTGYLSILEAVARAADVARDGSRASGALPPGAGPRADALDKVLGRALYAADLTVPGMLHGAVLRSPHSHAEILRIDDTKARGLPGVAAVVTARDVPGLNRYGRNLKDQRVLADGRVRQIGDAVAAVAAESPEIAARAVALLRVDYRPLPAVLDPAAALEEGAPAVHESGNLLSESVVRWGDVDAACAEAGLVVEETYTTQWCEHAYLEPEAVLAYLEPDGESDGTLVVRTATQHSHLHRDTVAETMGLPPERVRVVPTVVGGAFGGKTDVSCQCVAALLALKTGRPVKIVYSRAESFVSTTKRHPFRIRCRSAVTGEGRLTALDVEMLADTGAYASAAPNLFVRAGVSVAGPYHFPAGSVLGRAVYTNNNLAGSMRGFGAPQAAFAIESQMDIMASRLGIDPLEFSLMNRRTGDAEGAPPEVLEQEAAFEKTLVAVRPFYQDALRAREAANGRSNGRLRRGVGVACMRYGVGASGAAQAPGRASLELAADGRVRLLTGAMDLGQGSDMALALIVAGELALAPAEVSVVTGDTGLTSDAGPTSGSRLVYYVGNAARDAAVQLRQAILSTASELLERPLDELRLVDGEPAATSEAGGPPLTVTLGDVARARDSVGLALRFDGEFYPPPAAQDVRTGVPSPYAVYVSATHMAEVEVDLERGAVRVLRVVAAHDVGRAVFPQGVKGQIEGAVAMGIGFALKEEFLPGETVGFKEYRIPTAREMPEVVTLLVELGDPSAGLGAKGVAECATVAVAPAIANGIADATGARARRLPATPERLKALLAAASS